MKKLIKESYQKKKLIKNFKLKSIFQTRMVVKVLAIGDVGNTIRTLRKFVKKSEIHLINYPKDGSAFFVNLDGVELFKTRKVSEQVKRINQIKDDFDICLTTASERIAYLADLNYIAYYLGRDIDVPMFEKNSTESWQTEPLHKLNFFERKFYWNSFNNAIAHGMWSKARALADLAPLPASYSADVWFKLPMKLPSQVELLTAEQEQSTDFLVQNVKNKKPHLSGELSKLV